MRRWRMVVLVVLVCAGYEFFVSAGLDEWPVYGVYHDLQADGFLKGQLSLSLAPAPELLRMKDPYDEANWQLWALDATLYHGKYYAYWGPVPALVQAAAKAALGIKQPVGDQYLAFFFLCFGLVGGTLLIDGFARRLFPSLPRWLVALGVVAFGCANPTLHAATTASTYHTAIVAAQAWLVWGLLVAFDAVWYAGTARATASRLVAAGALWALAVGSRVTTLPAVALLIPITALAEGWSSEQRVRRAVANSLRIGIPVACVGVALLVYNKLRFDSFFEFGSKFQLSGYPLRFSTSYIIHNLYSYALRPWFASCQFPYLFAEWYTSQPFPKFLLPVPAGYLSPEPVVGFLLAVPLVWLAPLAFIYGARQPRPLTRRARVYWFCVASFTTLATVTGAVALAIYGSTMRYLSDVTYGLVLLSLLAAYTLRAAPRTPATRRGASALVASLAAVTIVIGLLLGYQGYNNHFYLNNRTLDRRIVHALSLCRGKPPELPYGWSDSALQPEPR
jgi:hypothetical protein